MSHPTYFPKGTFFYPIGNTPPICLTDHLPPNEDATVLLLGCGDPRSILYTVTADIVDSTRTMDLTCCDWEPAIIARNALLFTLIADSVEGNRVELYWNIFYDLFLDKQSVSILKEHCDKLVEYAADIIGWEASPYGSFLKFTTKASLDEARRHWASYSETLVLSNARQKELKSMFLSGMKESGGLKSANMSSVPSAAPMSIEFVQISTTVCRQYWKTGVTNPTVTSSTATQINPTFLFSVAGRRFHLHYGTDPCSAFHLALALTKVTFEDGSSSNPGRTPRDLWNACREQFSRWAVCLHRKLTVGGKKTPTVVIRLVVGEALAFCDAMLLYRTGDLTPTIYSSMWGSAKFSFHDHTIPKSFNVIDTSNLSDHIGLLNILIAASPLLERSPHTVLNTCTLLSYKDHPTRRSALIERAILDFPSLALFLGITPICYSSGLTFRNCSESASFSAFVSGNDTTRHYERVSWKISEFGHGKWAGTSAQRNHSVQFQPGDIADKLYGAYLKMFENEDLRSMFKKLSTDRSVIQDIIHYHRESFIRLLQVMRLLGHVETAWPDVLDRFIVRVTTENELLIGAHHVQNFFAGLHIWGIHSESQFLPGAVSNIYGPTITYRTWTTIPPVVCVVLKVPRIALKILEDVPLTMVGNPLIECATYDGTLHNIHDSIRPIFGKIVDEDGRKVIVEDTMGIKGDSPLIVSFFVSSWILEHNPRNLEVALCVKTTPSSSFNFAPKLGPFMAIYSAQLLDQEKVLILPERPDNQGELQRRALMSSFRESVSPVLGVTQFVKRGSSELLSKRLNVTDALGKEALVNKATVGIKQMTPHSIEVTIGDQYHYSLDYPIPVDGSCSKTRVARRSSYIEVDVPLRVSPLGEQTLQPFPLILAGRAGQSQIYCWNGPYVNLDGLPVVSLSKNPQWIRTHLGFCLSRRERNLEQAPVETWGPLLNFKASIANILIRYAKEKRSVYALQDPTRPRPHAIIFMNSIKIDCSSATIVGDAVVVFPCLANHTLARVLRGNNATGIKIFNDEIRWWNHAFPVFAERCRRWEHSSACEYPQNQRAPLSVEYEGIPLCSCGKGRDLGAFLKNTQWKDLIPHATRITLTPIFPVTYLEDVTAGVV